ncbi:MAG: hypothetical protein V2I54_07745 [Bacteroidales bacterium]|jgi:hypothetical protein|nr:hypothetical protein [Bacteroidales bacterium]
MIGKKRILLIGIVLLITVFTLFLFRVFKPAGNLHNVEPDFIVTSRELMNDFSVNEVLANSRYVDKILLVKGEIEEIIDSNDELIILLKTDDMFSGISCRMEDPEDVKAGLLKNGQRIIIKGQCAGKLIDVVLNHCVIVDD